MTGIQFKIPYIFTEQGNDLCGIVFFFQFLKGFAELTDTAERTPVIVVVTDKNVETADDRRVFFDGKGDVVRAVFFAQQVSYGGELFFRRRRYAVDLHPQNVGRFLIRIEEFAVFVHSGFLLSSTVLPARRMNSS